MSSVDFGVPDFCSLISEPDTWANLCFPMRHVSQLGAWFNRGPSSEALIFLAAGEGKSPTHNPTHNSWCLVRLTGILAVPACLLSCCKTYSRSAVTAEAGGSVHPGPTIR
jgi:hypothetical protein